jgi:hypothetical protein
VADSSILSQILGEVRVRTPFPSTSHVRETPSKYHHSGLYSFNNCVYAVLTEGSPFEKISEIDNQFAIPANALIPNTKATKDNNDFFMS